MCNKQPRQPKVRSHLKPTIRPATGSPGIFIKPPFRRGLFPTLHPAKAKNRARPFTSESSSILPYYRKSGIKTTVTVDISKKNAKFVRNLSCFLKPSAMKPSFRLPRRKIVERKSTLSINRAQNRRCSNSAKAENNGVKTNCFVEPRI